MAAAVEGGFFDTVPQASAHPLGMPPCDTGARAPDARQAQALNPGQTPDADPNGGALDLDLDLDLDLNLDLNAAEQGPVPDFDLDLNAPAQAAVVDPAQSTRPCAPPLGGHAHARRALVISADVDERVYIRARLAMGRWVWLDDASTTTQASAAMDDVRYVLALINLDASVIDAWALAARFKAKYPHALMVATSTECGRLPMWALVRRWRAWQLRRRVMAAGFDGLLPKPLRGRHMVRLIEQLNLNAKPTQPRPLS